MPEFGDGCDLSATPLAFALPRAGCRTPRPRIDCPVPILTDGRPLAPVSTAALTVYDAVAVAIWALLLFMVARRSKSSLLRDLFGLVVAVVALSST